jgi:nicotinate-nucleotide pyrophosphorylase (carboxylating)
MRELLSPHLLEKLAIAALEEDEAFDDITTRATVRRGQMGAGEFIVKAEGVICGLPVADAVFRAMHRATEFDALAAEGQRVKPGDVVAKVRGPLGPILSAERSALNLLQHMSGVATATAAYATAVQGTRARIVDTRKTLPGLRALDKYAVRCGGGHNHRFGLADGILIKDNHLAAVRALEGDIGHAVRDARATAHHLVRVEVEVETLAELQEALEAGADAVLLDNMSVEDMRSAVALTAGRAVLEASGGVTLGAVRAIAETGVDLISVGALTHSVTALDISLELEPSDELR